jgi:hypothetical protein
MGSSEDLIKTTVQEGSFLEPQPDLTVFATAFILADGSVSVTHRCTINRLATGIYRLQLLVPGKSFVTASARGAFTIITDEDNIGLTKRIDAFSHDSSTPIDTDIHIAIYSQIANEQSFIQVLQSFAIETQSK